MVTIFSAKGREKLRGKEKRWVIFLALRLGVILFSILAVVLILTGRYSSDPVSISMLAFAFLVSLINLCFFVFGSYPILPGVNVGLDLLAFGALVWPSWYKTYTIPNPAKDGICHKETRDSSDGGESDYNIDRYWRAHPTEFYGDSYYDYPESDDRTKLMKIDTWKLFGFGNPEACESYFKKVSQHEQAVCAFIILTLICELVLFIWACRRTHTRRMEQKQQLIEAQQLLMKSKGVEGEQMADRELEHLARPQPIASENPGTRPGSREDRITRAV